MICELILIGSQAFNPCDVVAIMPDEELRSVGFWNKVEVFTAGHCNVYLDNGSKHGLRLTIKDTPCPVVASQINQKLKKGAKP